MRIKAALVVSTLVAGFLAAGCRQTVEIPEAEAKDVAEKTLSSFAWERGVNPHRYKLHEVSSDKEVPWTFEYHLEGKPDDIVWILIDKCGRVEVSFSKLPDADTTSTGRKDGGVHEN